MIIFVGDCHGDFSEAVESIISYSSLGISGIIFLGDQTPEKTLEEELEDIGPDLIARTWFILGNHDSDYSKFVQNHAGIWSRHLHAKVIEFSGVHVAGLSGVFRRFAWYPPDEPKIERRDNSDINDIKYDANKAELTQHDALTRYTTIFPEDFKNLKRNKTDQAHIGMGLKKLIFWQMTWVPN
jgi:predicted phosphodiesterase